MIADAHPAPVRGRRSGPGRRDPDDPRGHRHLRRDCVPQERRGDPKSTVERDPVDPLITRSYKGKPDVANAKFAADAARLASLGYNPVNQNYVQGSWGCGAFLLALLLILAVGLGLLVLAYLVIVKPDGTLTVTYQQAGTVMSAPVPIASPLAASASTEERLRQLEELRTGGLVTAEEYAAKRKAILDAL